MRPPAEGELEVGTMAAGRLRPRAGDWILVAGDESHSEIIHPPKTISPTKRQGPAGESSREAP